MADSRSLGLVGNLFLVGCASANPGANVADASETVVLLHGMGRTPKAMSVLGNRLRDAGYAVQYFAYDAADERVVDIAKRLHAFVHNHVNTATYHFVGHSLGNIVVREASRQPFREGLARVVMLAPPNQPQELAAMFKDNPIYRFFTGDAGEKLASDSYYASLPAPVVPFGVIAGTSGQRLTFDDANDNVVRVEQTKLTGMADFVAVPHSHTFIMNADDTVAHLLAFLRTGQFERE